MKVIYTDEALRDIDEILTYISSNYPTVSTPFEKRLRTIVTRIGAWPQNAEEVAARPGVRMVPFIRYPYKVFLPGHRRSRRDTPHPPLCAT